MPTSVNRLQGGPRADRGAEPVLEPFGGSSAPGAARREDRRFRAAARTLRAFARGSRAVAGLELAIGAPVMLAVATLCFDLYSRVEADRAGARIAATMADYVSRGPDTVGGTLDGGALKKLGEFLWKRELGAPAALVYVVTAVHQPAGNPAPAAKVLWSDDDNLRFGDSTTTAELAGGCSRHVEENSGQTTVDLPTGFKMAAGEVTVIVEVCARLTRPGVGAVSSLAIGDLYRLHALPARSLERDWVPATPPVYAALGFPPAFDVAAFASPPAPLPSSRPPRGGGRRDRDAPPPSRPGRRRPAAFARRSPRAPLALCAASPARPAPRPGSWPPCSPSGPSPGAPSSWTTSGSTTSATCSRPPRKPPLSPPPSTSTASSRPTPQSATPTSRPRSGPSPSATR